MLPISPQVFWYDAVQVVLLLALLCMVVWMHLKVIDIDKNHSVRLSKLETTVENLALIVGNHYKHRFAKVRQSLGIDWDDDDKFDDERDEEPR